MPYKDKDKQREFQRKRYLKNKGYESDRKKKYYTDKKEVLLKNSNEYYINNKKERLEYSKSYSESNKESIKKRMKQYDNKRIVNIDKSYLIGMVRRNNDLSNESVNHNKELIKIQEIKVKLHRLIKSKKNGNK